MEKAPVNYRAIDDSSNHVLSLESLQTTLFLCDRSKQRPHRIGIHRLFAASRYDTMRYDIGYLTCSKKMTCSQLSPPHGTDINIRLKKKTN